MCARSREHLCMCKQMFCVSPAQQRSPPPSPATPTSIFLSSPSPRLSFHKHLFFGAMWVTPASQRQRCGIQVTLQSGRHYSRIMREGLLLQTLVYRRGEMRRSDNMHTWHKLVLKIRRLSTSICLCDCEQMSKLLQTKVIKAETQDGRVRHICFSLRSFSCLAQEQMTNGGGQV